CWRRRSEATRAEKHVGGVAPTYGQSPSPDLPVRRSVAEDRPGARVHALTRRHPGAGRTDRGRRPLRASVFTAGAGLPLTGPPAARPTGPGNGATRTPRHGSSG